MNYDKGNIPASYDAGRSYSRKALAQWLDVIAASLAGSTISRILDLGCGTGRFSEALANRFMARLIAIDPSRKMLDEAVRKAARRVLYARASGESVPLRDASVDTVFISMVFHHFKRPARVAAQCSRVLKVGGTVCLRAATTDQIGYYPYVPFFNRSEEILRATLQSQKFIEATFQRAGFERLRHELVSSEVASSWHEYADKIACGADSILAQLSRREFDNGLKGLRTFAYNVEDERVTEPVDFFVFRRR
jgi:SAM-dependent methyltransferase